MKRSILFGKYLVAILFVAVMVQAGCKKETGYYNVSSVSSATGLNTYQYLKSKPGVYDSLLFLIDKFGMQKYLTDSNVTLFAPSNSSFQLAVANLNIARKAQGKNAVYLADLAFGGKNYAPGKIKDKAIADSAHLDTMVSRYIIRKPFLSTDFSVGDGQNITSARSGYPMHGKRIFADAEGFQGGGVEVIEFANTKRSLFVARWSTATTTSVNIKSKNGIVHLLRPDHVFGFDEFITRLTLIPPPPVVFDYKNDGFTVRWPTSTYKDGDTSPGETFRKCLDGSVLTKFICAQSPTNLVNMYWFPKDPVKQLSNAWTMTSANDSKSYTGRDPKAFRLEGTLDPNVVANLTAAGASTSTWVQLDLRQDQSWTTNYQQKIFDFPNTVPYTGYRVIILQIGNEPLFQISEWTMNYRKN